MALNIKTQIENINRSLEWIRKNKPDEYERRFLEFVEQRRRLRKIQKAENNNPGIAAFGASQVGKSYLISNVLQQKITTPDGKVVVKQYEVDACGKRFIFINDINPITTDTEATGVVSRFSSFRRNPEAYNNNYPVLMKTLSIADITLMLCEGYFNDVNDYTTDGREGINEKIETLYERFKNREVLNNTPLKADDILEMRYYIAKYIKRAQEFSESNFFDKLSLFIGKIPLEEYVEIFSYLWHYEPNLTELYKHLIDVLRSLQFREEVHLPIESVLHLGNNENTIMSVQCLNGLTDQQNQKTCDVYVMEDNGDYKKLTTLTKSEISAVCAEVVFKIDKEFLESSSEYNFDSIRDEAVKRQLTHGEVKMEILKDVDMLDFPGAKSRLNVATLRLGEGQIITHVLLRGKVAYLFNKYSEDKIINILLYCHDYIDHNVTNIYQLLKEWVEQYVGKTPDERLETINKTGISPLFYIATKFNVDMREDQNPSANTPEALNERWNSRFDKVLHKICLNYEKWVCNWTHSGEFFQNSYLLRDFKHSGPKGSKLFSGFAETKKEEEALTSETHQENLRTTFCKNENVALFFSNRELLWDVAATKNNDGALYIIEKLKIAAEKISLTRQAQFASQCRKCMYNVLNLMKSYHKSDDTAEILAENLRKANGIFRELEFTCQSNPEYLGHLIQSLQLNETKCYSEIHRLVPLLPSKVGSEESIKDYELIRKRCDNFKGCNDMSQKWKILIDKYRFSSQEEAEDYLKRRGIDPAKLFSGGEVNRRHSAVIAHEMLKLWLDFISSSEIKNLYSGNGKMDPIVLMDLIDCIISAANDVQLRSKIEQEISPYVDILNIATINEDLVADAISTTISDFVMDFGYRYLTSEQRDMSYRVAREKAIDIYQQSAEPRKETYTEDEMAGLFNDILSSKSRFTPAYEANYNAWIEFMYIAHIAHLNVPDFDRAANDALTEILESIRQNL